MSKWKKTFFLLAVAVAWFSPLWIYFTVGNVFESKVSRQRIGKLVTAGAGAEDLFVRDFFDAMRENREKTLLAMISEEAKTPQFKVELGKVRGFVTDGNLVEAAPISVQRKVKPARQTFLKYLLRFEGGRHEWMMGEVLVLDDGGKKVRSFNIVPIPAQAIQRGTLSFRGLKPTHYTVMACAGALWVFSLWVFYLWLRTEMRWKWLWLLLILVGMGFFQFDWADGLYQGRMYMGLAIPGFQSAKGDLFAPWILRIYWPIGALIFCWLKRRELGLVRGFKKP